MSASVVFTWKDSKGVEFEVVPRFTASGIQFPETGEDMPNFFHFAAGRGVSAVENAGRFSELSRAKRDREFIKVFSNEYKFIDDISIEVHAGQPVLYATLKGVDEKIPLANVSHGINRLVGIMLAIASRPQSIVLVDEIESGIYYKHKTAIWRSILTFMRKYDSQLFVTTHDIEWLKALVEAAGKKNDDISLWRLKRNRKHPVLDQFKGETLKHGIEFGQEVR